MGVKILLYIKEKKNREQKKALFVNLKDLLNLFILMIILFTSVSLDILFIQSRVPQQSSLDSLRPTEFYQDEAFVDYGWNTLDAGMSTRGSIIRVNYTVLPQSNSSVEFRFHYHYLDYETWVPAPQNYTLAIGSSFEEEFTLNRTINQITLPFIYDARVVSGGTNATVRWWREVLVTGKTPAANFFVLSGSFILLSVGVMINTKRKAIRKE